MPRSFAKIEILSIPKLSRPSLFKDVLLGQVTKDGITPFHLAVRSGQKQMVCCLLSAKVDAQKKGLNGSTSVHLAAQYGHCQNLGLCDNGLSDHVGPIAFFLACRELASRIRIRIVVGATYWQSLPSPANK